MSQPNVEMLVVDFLSNSAIVIADIGANKVSTELPANAVMPRIRVSLAGGLVRVRKHLYSVRVGLESGADDKTDAYENLISVLDALENTLEGALVAQGVVNAVEHDSGIIWSPDNLTDMPRYLTTVVLTVHSLPQ